MARLWVTPALSSPAPASCFHTKAVAFMMLSVGLYAIQDVLVKSLPDSIHIVEIIFFRSLFSCVVIVCIAPFESSPALWRTRRFRLHFFRCFFACIALVGFISSFRLIPLADAYALTFSAPLFLTVMAHFYLGEKIGRQRCVTVCLGFLGIIVMLRPTGNALNIGGLMALAGGFFHAVSLIQTRELTYEDSNSLIVATFTLTCFILSGLVLPFFWSHPPLEFLENFIMIGLLGGSAQYAMIHSYRLAPVSSIAPFDYVAIIWAVAFGYYFWGHIPDFYIIIGSCLIIGGGLHLIYYERQKEKFRLIRA
jgi:drug/metabolite transporter (DMT)-like permease